MANYINLYTNNPTHGGTDGTVVSSNGAQTSPFSVTLDASQSETKYIKGAVRCQNGYYTVGDTVISFTGTTSNKWSIAPYTADSDNMSALTFTDSLTISNQINANNVCFWLKVSSDATEEPSTDITTSVQLSATIAAE